MKHPETLRILLVDSIEAEAEKARRMLESNFREHLELEHVNRLDRALERMSRQDIDLVILDLDLPDGQGVAILEKVLASHPQVTAVVLTKQSNEKIALAAIGKGAQDYLLKERIDSHDLRRSIVYARARKKSIIELRESEAMFRSLFETMTLGVVYQDSQGRITAANPAAEEILGLREMELRKRTSMDRRWKAVREDKSPFPGEEHPSMQALRSGKRVKDVVMGVWHPSEKAYRWILVDAVPQFKPEQDRPFQVFTTFSDITKRKQAEEELARRERRLRQSERRAGLGHWEYDLKSGENTWYENMYMIFGYSPGEIEPSYVFNVERTLHLEESGLFDRMRKRLKQGESPLTFEYRIVKKDGSLGYMRTVAEVERDEQGKVVKILGTTQDITERKQAEEELRQEKERLQKILDNIPVMINFKDPEGRFEYINSCWQQTLGWSLQEVQEQDVLAQAYPEPEVHDRVTRSIRMAQRSWQEFMTRTKQGKVLDTMWMTVPLADGSSIGIGMDITERKLMLEQLQKQKEYSEKLIQTANAMIVSVDQNGRVTLFNNEAERITGYSRQEVLGRNWFELVVPLDRYPQVWQAFQGGVDHFPSAFENPILTKEGEERIISWRNSTMQVNDSIRGISFGIDITEQRRAEGQLESQRRDLEEANAALRVLLRQSDRDRMDMEEKVLANINRLVLPHIEHLQGKIADPSVRSTLKDITHDLTHITSSFSKELTFQHAGLTPTELRVADLIRHGKRSKEIGEQLSISSKAVDFHRANIRRKLGLTGKRTNLLAYLQSIS